MLVAIIPESLFNRVLDIFLPVVIKLNNQT
jgi:hypothetical protein